MTAQSLEGLMQTLSQATTVLFSEEREAAAVLAAGVARAFPKGRVYVLLSEDADPALVALDALVGDVSDLADSLALIEDQLTEIKRMRRAGRLTG